MREKDKKVLGAILAEYFVDGGSDGLVELYNNGGDWLPREAQIALHGNTDLGEEIEEYMNIELAKLFAKYAGGKFVPKQKKA